MSLGSFADFLIGFAGACGVSPHEARQCSVRDLESIYIVASEMYGAEQE